MIQVQSSFIDLGISVVFIILMFSVFHSGILELFQVYVRSRNHFLYKKLKEVLNDRRNYNLCEKIYNHPIVQSTKPKSSTLPAYISSDFFSDGLIGVLCNLYPLENISLKNQSRTVVYNSPNPLKIDPSDLLSSLKGNLDSFQYSDVKILLTGLVAPCTSIEEVKSRFVTWYEGYMERVSSQYKRKLMKWSMLLGIVIAFACNANLIVIVKALKEDSLMNSRVSTLAVQMNNNGQLNEIIARTNSRNDSLDSGALSPIAGVQEAKKELDSTYKLMNQLGLPIGWNTVSDSTVIPKGYFSYVNFRSTSFLTVLLGYFLMGIAISFGSEYWFNILSKLINIRGAIKPSSSTKNK